MTLLSVENISKSYGPVQALKNVSLDFEEKEIFVLLGPSGSGKSTLLQIISGTLKPDEGRVYLRGKDVTDLAPYERDISLVWQDLELFPHMTVKQNIIFPLRMKKRPKSEQERKFNELLKFAELEGMENRYPKELSGGEQQRVALARGLVSEPSVLLLDEPLANLDRIIWERMLLELKILQRRIGITFVYITHNQIEALAIGDRIGVINKGELLQVDTPDSLYNDPKARFVAKFIGSSNEFEGKVTGIEDGFAEVDLAGNTVKVKSLDDVKLGDKMLFYVKSEDFRIGETVQRGENMVRGQIITSHFKGQMTDYTVRLPGDKNIVVSERETRKIFREGQEVSISWAPTDARGFKG